MRVGPTMPSREMSRPGISKALDTIEVSPRPNAAFSRPMRTDDGVLVGRHLAEEPEQHDLLFDGLDDAEDRCRRSPARCARGSRRLPRPGGPCAGRAPARRAWRRVCWSNAASAAVGRRRSRPSSSATASIMVEPVTRSLSRTRSWLSVSSSTGWSSSASRCSTWPESAIRMQSTRVGRERDEFDVTNACAREAWGTARPRAAW